MTLHQPHLLAVVGAAVAIVVSACAAERPVEPGEADEARNDRSAAAPATGLPPETATAHAEIEYMTFALNHHMAGVAMTRLCLHKATHHELESFCERIAERQTEQLHRLQAGCSIGMEFSTRRMSRAKTSGTSNTSRRATEPSSKSSS